MVQKIIVIGGGIAGLSAAQAARETDPAARIHLICGEKRLPYYRTRICEIFSGLDPDKLVVRNFQWFIDADIDVVMAFVTSVNSETRQVRFSDGSYLYYDKLIITTGANGNLPPARGNDSPNVVPLRKMADIGKIQSFTGPVVVVGDGLLGLEAAWHLSREGRSVVIVGRGDRLLSRQLDKEGSSFFLNIVEKAGIRVALRGDLEAIEDGQAILADGRGFDAAAVVFAAGIKSDITLANRMGLFCNRGIVVDEHMHTNLPDIWAAGDCAEYEGRVYGQWKVSMAQGSVAGACAAGADKSYEPDQPAYLMNAMGTKVWSSGDIDAADSLCEKDARKGNLIKLFFADGILTGAELIGDTGKMLGLKKAIDQGISRDKAIEQFLNIKQEEIKMQKYECKICGYVYDPAENDGVPFEQLPDDWVCPLCGAGKSEFEAQ